MITLAGLKKKAENLYMEVLRSHITGESFFPKIIRSDKTLPKDLPNIYKELEPLIAASKERKGYGYSIKYTTVQTRDNKKQDRPTDFVFDTLDDYLRFTGKSTQYHSFIADYALLIAYNINFKDWAIKNIKGILENTGKWPELLKVCEWFVNNPHPNCYIREIPAQPHTKFIENNKSIIERLLTELIGDMIFKEGVSFEERLHLKAYERLLHIRLLDEKLTKYFSGLSHIGITIPDLAKLNLPCRKVIIMENKASYSNIDNFLTLPHLQDTIAIFGSGYSVRDLKHITWLHEKKIYYWGDIDEHGFQILHQFRSYYPHTQSILMDMEAYKAFEQFAVSTEFKNIGTLSELSDSEQEVFKMIQSNPLKNRLEQERISQEYVLNYLEQLFNT